MTIKPGNLFNYLAGLLLLVFGFIYLFRNTFMPYHEMALMKDWSELELQSQFLILALMRAVGGGFLSTALAVIILQYRFSVTGDRWIAHLIFAIGMVISAGTLFATIGEKMNTPGNPPMIAVLVGALFFIQGYVFNLRLGKRKEV